MKLMRLLSAAVAAVSLVTVFVAPSGATRVVENLFAAKLIDANRGWVVGAFGAVYRTDDGGATWRPSDVGTDKTLFGVDFRSATDGWVVGMVD